MEIPRALPSFHHSSHFSDRETEVQRDRAFPEPRKGGIRAGAEALPASSVLTALVSLSPAWAKPGEEGNLSFWLPARANQGGQDWWHPGPVPWRGSLYLGEPCPWGHCKQCVERSQERRGTSWAQGALGGQRGSLLNL